MVGEVVVMDIMVEVLLLKEDMTGIREGA